MEYKNCLFFKIENGLKVRTGKDNNNQEILLNEGFFAVVKTQSGNVSFVRDYKKENGTVTELNRYYPSTKGKVIQ
ncbi:MAG: hypothetical protein PHD20_02800 [Clostridia bacterium]|nr:hypothetical protein [Clostridia bacterium]